MSKYKDILKQYWGYDSFRPLQEDIIESVGKGKDTLALMPTGGGKSITFQVPSLATDGICLVITPLIALMKDQVENLKKRGIKALAIHSGMSRQEINIALDNASFGDFKFLYLSPERLVTEKFKARVQGMDVNLIAVDEAHCISQWGYDFRPSYLRIAELRELLPYVPVLALTATATPRVAEDIMDKLSFPEHNVLKMSFERKNLIYVVRNTEDKYREILKIAQKIGGSGVVYVRNRRKSRELAELLRVKGISADYYHAGLKYELRTQRQDAWQQDKIRVMVATNAFGMGIDKPDVRFVVHVDLPDSPEAYFQEAGRAGRDEQRAWAILLHSPADEKMVEKRIDVNFPSFDLLKEIYQALFIYLQVPIGAGKGMSFDFILGEFVAKNKINALTVSSALTILAREGYFEITEEINNPSRMRFIVGRDDLYKFQVKNPKFDSFVKLVLRSYTGLFSQFVNFDEYNLAKRSGLSREDVYKYLVKLSSLNIINYVPKKGNPVITLLEERLDNKNIYISPEKYRFRKERYVDRAKELLEYASSETKCRSKFLLSYFGEKNAKSCGQCDVCLHTIRTKATEEEYQKYSEKIIESLQSEPKGLRELSVLINENEDFAGRVIERMLQEGRIQRRIDLKFENCL